MPKTAIELTPEELAQYRPEEIVRERRERTAAERRARWQQARAVAEEAAAILRERFGARRVLIFGSGADPEAFTLWSDIDLAVEGVAPERFYAAVAAVMDLSPDFRVDLIDVQSARPSLRAAIEQEGVEL